MSAVSLGDQAKALSLLGTGSAKRDEMLHSLARQTSWTDAQRGLVDAMWNERQQQKEGAMKKKTVVGVGLLVAMALSAGCAATYEKRFTDHDGREVVITEHHDPDFWNTIGTPNWMDVRHETITRDGKIVADRECRHEPTKPQLLDCTEQK